MKGVTRMANIPKAPRVDEFVVKSGAPIVGAKVVRVAVADIGGGMIAPFIEFDNGVFALIMQDSEGNGAGALHLEKNNKGIGCITVW
jgi:glycerate-2-kinase